MSSIIKEKSESFALDIIETYKYLSSTQKEYVLSKQVLRSGTSIGANVCEAHRGQSKADFYAKLSISLKEAEETAYWLRLLYKSNYLDKERFDRMDAECEELIRILVAIQKRKESK